MTEGRKQSARFFYGLQPRWWTRDRLYRIYVCDKMISGAYVAGQVYDEESAALQFHQLWIGIRPLVLRFLARRQERESLYDTIDPFSRSLLDHDARNFQIWRSEVTRTRFRRNRSLWAPYNVGVVELTLLDGKKLRFILVGEQQPDEVLGIMQVFDPAIEVTGKPSPLLKPLLPPKRQPMKPMSRLTLVILAASCLSHSVLFGALFVLLAVRKWLVQSLGELLMLVSVNFLLVGLWLLVRAWNFSEDPPKSTNTNLDS